MANSQGLNVLHYLCSSPFQTGLRVYFAEELVDIEYHDSYIIGKDYIHPILKNILDTDWQLYEHIGEGVADAWLEFERQLGYKP
ncbi:MULTISPECIES: hypothetical protein [unclassified Acinetobacter]|uniref:hypothetical protein n=1 Tax=unclassified Acinetobacter TaxID=196816 RepID=UPI0035B7F798